MSAPRPGTASRPSSPPGPTHARSSARPWAATRALWAAWAWAVVFVLLHVYWVLGGRLGIGDQADPLPSTTSSPVGWAFTLVVGAMFLAGLAVPLALVQPWGWRLPRRSLLVLMWVGGVVLGARGGLGLLDDALRLLGSDGGLTGLSYEQTLGTPHPSATTLWSSAGVDLLFLVGGVLFTDAARLVGRRARSSHLG